MNALNYRKFDAGTAQEYSAFADRVFAPIYPLIADLMIRRCRIAEGTCVELGAGAAHLAMAMAKVTRLRFYAVDFSQDILQIARRKIRRKGLLRRITPVVANVHGLPFPSGFADLVVSRGSMGFWRNKTVCFREILRILKKGGRAFIGGGVGSAEQSLRIEQEMKRAGRTWKKRFKKRSAQADKGRYERMLVRAGASRYEIIRDDTGFWITMEKER